MSNRHAQVIVLVEDKQQRAFVTRLLQQLGYDRHKLRLLPLPAGHGSGEQYVREQYAEQVRELRRRSGHLQIALAVVLDADTEEVAARQRQLSREMESANMEPRRTDERIIHLIPRRNIETWIAYLLGQQVNEYDLYPRLTGRERDCQPAVVRFLELSRSSQPLPVECPSSLVAALDELRRLA